MTSFPNPVVFSPASEPNDVLFDNAGIVPFIATSVAATSNVIYSQNFTATNGTNVTSLSPQVGSGAFTSIFDPVTVQNNRAIPAGIGYIVTPSLGGSGNIHVDGIFRFFTSPNDVSLIGRNLSGGSYYALIGGSDIRLQRYDAVPDTDVLLDTWSWTRPLDTDVAVRISCIGSTISVVVDGVTRISVTDATYSGGAGQPGIFFLDPNGATATTGTHADDFVVLNA